MGKSKNIQGYDLKKLEKSIKTLDKDKKNIALGLLNKVVYLDGKLIELQRAIDQSGLTIQMQQGDYFIERANPNCATYNQFLKQYSSMCKQINDMLPLVNKELDINDFLNEK